MNEIPEDILKAADAVFERGYNEGLVDAIARAILAERKRCADAVHRAAKEFYGNTDQMYAAALIVSAIEAGQ